MTESESKRPTPAYVSYKTFTNFINSLQESGVPSQIDRSMLKGMSGSAQSAILGSLEYLNLISKTGNVLPKFHQLIDAEEKERAAILRAIVEASYPFLFSGSIDLKRATTKQVEDEFRKNGVSGSTVVKCIAFFLSAAKAAGVAVSPHVKTPTVMRTPSTKRVSGAAANSGASEEDDEEQEVETPPGTQRLKLPLVGKQDVVVLLPADFNKEDWTFLKPIFEAYIVRLIKD